MSLFYHKRRGHFELKSQYFAAKGGSFSNLRMRMGATFSCEWGSRGMVQMTGHSSWSHPPPSGWDHTPPGGITHTQVGSHTPGVGSHPPPRWDHTHRYVTIVKMLSPLEIQSKTSWWGTCKNTSPPHPRRGFSMHAVLHLLHQNPDAELIRSQWLILKGSTPGPAPSLTGKSGTHPRSPVWKWPPFYGKILTFQLKMTPFSW